MTDDSYRINDLQSQIDALRQDRDRWRRTAEQLAKELGKVGYALTEYEDQHD